MAAGEDHDDQARIGRRLKEIRRELKATLADISARTGVSISALSKIENAQIWPSYDILKRICDGLDIGLEDVVSSAAKSMVSGRKTLTRSGEGDHFTSGQYGYRAHATELSRKGMVPLEMTIHARSIDDFDHWSRHGGEEFVYVLSGRIEVHTEHYAPYQLATGESTYFDSSMKHLFVSVGDDDARILSVSHDPGARQHADHISRFMHPAAREIDAAAE